MGRTISRKRALLLLLLLWAMYILAGPSPLFAQPLQPVFHHLDQGLNENEEDTAREVIRLLLDEYPYLDMILTLRQYTDGQYAYQVFAKRDTDGDGDQETGFIWFRRGCLDPHCNAGLKFTILEESPEGFNAFLFGDPDDPHHPLRDPAALATLDEEIQAGSNPNNYPCSSLGSEDPRCSYIEPEEMTYPYVYERLAAVLDEPRAGDLVIIPKSYSGGTETHLGSHGHPGVVQSRMPLIMAGAGVKKGFVFDDPERVPRIVDIAPTVAYLMGLPKMDGANFSGLTSSQRGVAPDVYLDRQDGEVIQGIYDLQDKILYTYLVVIDGLRPEDMLRADVAPNISRLIHEETTTYWDQARAVMTTRTNANHTAMITGAYGAQTGIVGNEFCDRGAAFTSTYEGQTLRSHCTPTPLEDPSLLEAETLFQAIEAQRPELVTAAVFGKQKLTDLLSRGADIAWGPEQAGLGEKDPVTGYAFDWRTMDEVLRISQHYDPDFTFVNLADVDRIQHVAGPGSQEALDAVGRADEQVQRLIEYLKRSGKWERSVVILTADHSFTPVSYRPQHHILLKFLPQFRGDDDVVFLANGPTNHLYYRDFDPTNEAHQHRLAKIRERLLARGIEGIDEVLYRLPNPFDPGYDLRSVHPDWGLDHERAGDLIVTALPGYTFCDHPNLVQALGCFALPVLKGDHGGPYQRHVPMLITGGSSLVKRQVRVPENPERIDPVDDTGLLVPEQAEAVDIAPTVAWLYRIEPPAQSQGRILAEAFRNPEDPLEALGPYAPFVMLMISDGLSHTAVLNALEGNLHGVPQPSLLPAEGYGLRYLVENGVLFRHGAISNFPSVTYPSHNSMGSGAWSGHHGIVGNRYFERERDHLEDPFTRYLFTEKNLRSRPLVATLHERAHDQDAWGPWNRRAIPQGAFTASVNEPSTRGADYAVLELRLLPLFAFPTYQSLLLPYLEQSAKTHGEGGDTDPRYEEMGLEDVALSSVVDSLGQAMYRALVEEPGLAMPRYTSFNFTLTDSAAHFDGPHGEIGTAGLQDTDLRLSRMIRSVRDQGLLRKTLFVLSADHGMESQDPSRSGGYKEILDAHGIRYQAVDTFLYLECLNVELDTETFVPGRDTTVTVTVTDDDLRLDGQGNLVPPPIAGARVTLTNGPTKITRTTGPEGRASLGFRPVPQDVVTIEVRHDAFNPRVLRYEVVQPCGCSVAQAYAGTAGCGVLAVQAALDLAAFVLPILIVLRCHRRRFLSSRGPSPACGSKVGPA